MISIPEIMRRLDCDHKIDLANKLGTTIRIIDQWQSKRNNPSFKFIKKIIELSNGKITVNDFD